MMDYSKQSTETKQAKIFVLIILYLFLTFGSICAQELVAEGERLSILMDQQMKILHNQMKTTFWFCIGAMGLTASTIIYFLFDQDIYIFLSRTKIRLSNWWKKHKKNG